MPDANVFEIQDAVFALALVDTAAVGYLSTWNAPGGATVDTVTLADFVGADDWRCQITSGVLTSKANTRTRTRAATFCAAAAEIPVTTETAYTLDAEWFQDPHVAAGLSRFCFEHDTKEAYFYLGLGGDATPPQAIGRVRISSGNFGGKPREELTAKVSFGCTRKPKIEFGDATTSAVV